MFFLELLEEFNPELGEIMKQNWKEGNELLSIIIASIMTICKNENNRKF